MALNLELAEQTITFEDGPPNIFYHPLRCIVAGKNYLCNSRGKSVLLFRKINAKFEK